MKITIDTKEDSHAEIKKVVQMLNHLVGKGEEVYTNEPKNVDIFSDSSDLTKEAPIQPDDGSEDDGSMFSMFGDTNPEKKEVKEDIANQVFGESEEVKEETVETKEEDDSAEIIPYD